MRWERTGNEASTLPEMKLLLCLKLIHFFVFSDLCAALLDEDETSLPRNVTTRAVIVFGDSIVDTGNNNYLKTLLKCNYPPYGSDFVGRQATGRYSNGKVPSDLFAEGLAIKPLLPPYLDPSLQPQDLLTGVNFASGVSGYDPLTSQLVLSLSDQLNLFKEYKAKLKKIAGEETSALILKESLFAVATGSNDITNTYYATSLRRFEYDLSSYIDLLVSCASTFVQDLHELGARRIGVFGLPPLGCLPSQRSLWGGRRRECVDELNEAAKLFNTKLSSQLISINNKLVDAVIVYGDVYHLPLNIMQHPHIYGFKIGDKGCCGTGTIEVAFLCRYACFNASEYVFWDSFHPTERMYRLLVQEFINNYIKTINK